MGDRSNIVVEYYTGDRVYLYGHWMGEESIKVTSDVLSKCERWNDESYLARMLFSEMTAGDTGTTGYGIAPYAPDNEHTYIVLRPERGVAWLEDTNGNKVTRDVPFDEFYNTVERYDTSYTFSALLHDWRGE